MNKIARLAIPLGALLLTACASYRLEKALDAESREFLSRVRYLIIKEERETLLSLPSWERQIFIDEFWKKRDPTPETEENEFKEQYFRRIDETNRLFRNEGAGPGWVQDRGRIYILLGPPTNRETYPRGMTFYGKPTEIWYYDFFPIVFVDEAWNGDYKLTPLGADQIGMINSAQMGERPETSHDERALDFRLQINKTAENQILVRVSVPYKRIWMKLEGQNLQTSLDLLVELSDPSEKKVWEFQKNYPLSLTEQRLDEIINESYIIEVPVQLKAGTRMLYLSLTNTADGSKLHKRANLNF